MVGGGIGVTPYASTLMDLVLERASGNHSGIRCKRVRYKINYKKIFFELILRFIFYGYAQHTKILNGLLMYSKKLRNMTHKIFLKHIFLLPNSFINLI